MNDSLVNTTHKTRPWRDVSYAIAAPGRDRGKANVGYLAAGFMRVLDNTQHNSDGVLQIAKHGTRGNRGSKLQTGDGENRVENSAETRTIQKQARGAGKIV